MFAHYDLLIRNGTIVDGRGGAPFAGDVGIRDGRIVAVGHVPGSAGEEIDAAGCLVTPGFVDIHTHYDGQVTWEQRTDPSANHGVTTIMIGNCGVGFAPCRPGDRDLLVGLMEGVEDIPEVVLTEGLTWDWETFPDFLRKVDALPRDIDTVALLPHSCVRVYVMGKRGADREPATPADLNEMTRITQEAMEAGAMGVGTSRILFHRSTKGEPIPSKDAGEDELQAIAEGMRKAGTGIFQAVLDMNNEEIMESELRLLERVSKASGRPISYTLVQLLDGPEVWRGALELTDEINRNGSEMTAQVIGRPTGLLLGLNASANPFSLHPTYRKIQHLPLTEKVAEMRKPEVRAQLLSESPKIEHEDQAMLRYLHNYDVIFPLGDPPNYEPSAEESIASIAKRHGVTPEEVAYDLILEDDGNASLFHPFANYADGNLDAVLHMMKDEHTVLGLGDGGAHCGLICDAGYPTFMLTYWTRDRIKGERLPVEQVIRWMTLDTARVVGLNDRGILAPGYKADVNVIDYHNLVLDAPRASFDLPGGGRRLKQGCSGYRATIKSGAVTYREGVHTGALPGRLVRGVQAAAPLPEGAIA